MLTDEQLGAALRDLAEHGICYAENRQDAVQIAWSAPAPTIIAYRNNKYVVEEA